MVTTFGHRTTIEVHGGSAAHRVLNRYRLRCWIIIGMLAIASIFIATTIGWPRWVHGGQYVYTTDGDPNLAVTINLGLFGQCSFDNDPKFTPETTFCDVFNSQHDSGSTYQISVVSGVFPIIALVALLISAVGIIPLFRWARFAGDKMKIWFGLDALALFLTIATVFVQGVQVQIVKSQMGADGSASPDWCMLLGVAAIILLGVSLASLYAVQRAYGSINWRHHVPESQSDRLRLADLVTSPPNRPKSQPREMINPLGPNTWNREEDDENL